MKKYDILKIYKAKSTVFTTKEIALIWQETDLSLVKSRIFYYVKKNKLYHLRRGIYARDKHYDRLELATKIFKPSYVSLETVLQKEGVIFQYYKSISVVSYLSREIVCDGQKFVFHKIKPSVLLNDLGLEKKENYFIATRERAFLDVLYLYKNYHFDNLKSLDWQRCFEMAPIYDNKTLIKRLHSYYQENA